jgi:predicted DNA-binding protein
MTLTNINYGIMIIATSCYTFLLAVGVVMAVRTAKRQKELLTEAIENIINELHDIVHKEDIMGNLKKNDGYKNISSSQYIDVDGVAGKEKSDDLTLTGILTNKPTEEDYKYVLGLLVELARNAFKDYQFLIAKSDDEAEQAHHLQLISVHEEYPTTHKAIFRHAVRTNMDMNVLRARFAELAASGEVLDLGDNVVVITDDGTGNPPTGVQPINMGLEGGQVRFNFEFVLTENYEAWWENHFSKEEEGNE